VRRILDAYSLEAQARPDWYSSKPCKLTDAPYTCDLKSTDDLSNWYDPHDPDSDVAGRAIIRFGYHRQAALAHMLLREETGKDTDQFLIVSEKEYPHRCAVIQLQADWIAAGLREVERDLAALANCYAKLEWELSPAGIIRPTVPSWYAHAEGRATFWNS
jgi:hypothetical protein